MAVLDSYFDKTNLTIVTGPKSVDFKRQKEGGGRECVSVCLCISVSVYLCVCVSVPVSLVYTLPCTPHPSPPCSTIATAFTQGERAKHRPARVV